MMNWPMMGGSGGSWGFPGFGFFGFGWLFMIAFWALIIVGVVLVIKALIPKESEKLEKTTETALDILKKRYAQGEISKEEFEEKRQGLQ